MRKTIIAALAFLAFQSNAQTFNLGLRTGFAINNYSNVYIKNNANEGVVNHTPASLNLGLVSEVSFCKNFSLQNELALTGLHYTFTENYGLNQTATYNFEGSYFGLNAIGKIKLPITDKFEAFAMLGVGVDMNVSDLHTGYLGNNNQSISNWNSGWQMNNVLFKGIFGAGASYQINKIKLFIDARHNQSFSNIYKMDNGREARISQLGFNLGLMYQL